MRGYLLFLLTTLALVTVPSLAQKQALEVQPAKPRQGDALFVRLREPEAQGAQVRWRNETFQLFRDGDAWTGVVPVVPDTPAGGHTLVVSFQRDGRTIRLPRSVQVTAVRYPIQRLKMARTTSSLYNYPGVEKEEVPLSRAIRTKSDERLWSGDWALPVKGRLSTPFGVKRLRNGKAVGRHRGTDIAAPTGTKIVAPANGRVMLAESAKKFKKYGGTVVLDHGMGLTSMYIHMSAVTARVGDVVQRGEELGRVGAEGVATGPHLHWSVYAHGDSIEPLFFTRLSKRGVRQ